MPKQEQNWCYTKLNAGLGTVLQSMTSSSLRTIDLVLCESLVMQLDKQVMSSPSQWSLKFNELTQQFLSKSTSHY